MRKLIIVMVLMAVITGITAQVNVSSSYVDSLETEMRNSNFSYKSQMNLINFYLSKGYKEAALLNFSFLKRDNSLSHEDLKTMSQLEYDLELIEKSSADLSALYLLKPDLDTILRLSVLYSATGDKEKALRLLNRNQSEKHDKYEQLRNLYVELYNNNKTILATACREILWTYDYAMSSKYFVKPVITIISPEKNTETNSGKSSIVFQVKHEHPVKNVYINNVDLAQSESLTKTDKEYKKDFSYLADLSEGTNQFIIKVVDINGETQTDTLQINQFSFTRNLAWKSAESDTLFNQLKRIRNYYPEKMLISQKDKNQILCIVDTNSKLNEQMLTLFDLISDPLTGSVETANAKLICQNRAVSGNLNTYLGQSLLKQVNFNTRLILGISGRWHINRENWMLEDIHKNQVNIKPYIENLFKYASSGITLIIGGQDIISPVMKSQLEQMIQQSVNPVQIIFLNNQVWKNSPNQFINANIDQVVLSYPLHDILNGEIIQNNKFTNQSTLIYNPYYPVKKSHNELYSRTEQKLISTKVSDSDKNKILNFCSDWRRYNEMSNYLKNSWTLNDLLVRVNDFEQRQVEE